MEYERVFVIGDIHGCLAMLKRLICKIDWAPERDCLIFLGDYIDRGEDSKRVIDFILGLSDASPDVRCLMGNHESIFLDYLSGKKMALFTANGGGATLKSYQKDGKVRIPPEHITFLKNLHPWTELEDYYFVHAGFRPGVEVRDQSREDMIWIRDPFLRSDYDFGEKVIFGHTPFHIPLQTDYKIGLDTGAVYGNRLTCLELPLLRFHSVEG